MRFDRFCGYKYHFDYRQMNEKYDAVVCGTGLAECILSGLLSQERKTYPYPQRRKFSMSIETPSTEEKVHPSI